MYCAKGKLLLCHFRLFAGNTTTAAAISPTPTTNAAMSSTVTPTAPSEIHSFKVIMEFVNITWKMELLNKTSQGFIELANEITEAVENAIQVNNSLRVNVDVEEFKPGSVLAFLNISTNKTEAEAKKTLQSQMLNGKIGSFSVSKTLFSGQLLDVVLKIKAECNDSLELKGFNQSQRLIMSLAVQEALPGNEVATVQKVACPDPANVTIVTVRVQVENSSTENPNKELQDLRDDVKEGRLGNFTLIPAWQAYIPGEKQFSASFDLTTPSQNITTTIEELEKAIKNIFQNDTDYRYVTVELLEDNKTAVVKVGMKTGAPNQPNDALRLLKESVAQGNLGQIPVVKRSFKSYINPNTVTQKEFEIHFRLNMSDCDTSDASKKAEVVEAYINRLKDYEHFIEAKLQNAECVYGSYYKQQRFVQAFFLVYVSPTAPDFRGLFNRYLYKCGKDSPVYDWGVKIVTLTPTSPDVNAARSYTHWVCPKPKPTPTTPTTEEPTSSSGTPPVEQKLPSLYVKVKLGITWGEFCSKLEHSLKQKIAWNLYDKNDTRVSPDRIIFINVEKNCADPSKKDEQAEVWFYVSKSGSKKLHKCLTLKAYKVLKMFLENGNTKPLGPDFEGKVRIRVTYIPLTYTNENIDDIFVLLNT